MTQNLDLKVIATSFNEVRTHMLHHTSNQFKRSELVERLKMRGLPSSFFFVIQLEKEGLLTRSGIGSKTVYSWVKLMGSDNSEINVNPNTISTIIARAAKASLEASRTYYKNSVKKQNKTERATNLEVIPDSIAKVSFAEALEVVKNAGCVVIQRIELLTGEIKEFQL